RGRGYDLFFTSQEAVLVLDKPHSAGDTGPQTQGRSGAAPARDVVRLQFVGANPATRLTAAQDLLSRSNYFRGDRQFTTVGNYGTVTGAGLYDGIDVVYTGTARGELEFSF